MFLGLLTDRVFPAITFAASIIGAAAVLFAQSVFDPFASGIERLVGGSVLLIVAGLIIRWTRHMLADIQEIRERENEAALKREGALLEQLDRARQETADMTAALTQERALRISLEQAGIVERRTDPRTLDQGD